MKRILITSAFIIALIAMSFLYFNKKQQEHTAAKLYQAIPKQFPIAFESENWPAFFNKIDTFTYGKLVNEKDWYAGVKTNYSITHSLLDSLQAGSAKKNLIALGNNGSNGLGLLSVSELKLSSEAVLKRLAELNIETKQYQVADNQVISILNYNEQYDFHIALKDGLLILSFEPSFVEGALIALSKKSTLWQERNASSSDDFLVYIKPKELNFLANYLLKPSYFEKSNFLAQLTGNTIIACNFFKNEIVFSGNSVYEQATLLDTLKFQNTAMNSSLAYLPHNVSMYQSLSFNDTLFQTDDYVKNSFYEQLNKSYTLFWLNAFDAAIDNNRAVILSVSDKETMLVALREIDAELLGVENYQNTAIYKAKTGSFFNQNLLLDQVFDTEVYFTFVENNMIVMNSITQVQQYLDNLALNNLLNTKEAYLQLRNGSAAQSNLNLYADFQELRPFFTEISLEADWFTLLSKMGVQFSNNKGSVYLQGKIEWQSEQQAVLSKELWRTSLATNIATKAFEVIDFNTQSSELILQDDSNQVTLLSKTGEVIFTVTVNGQIQGEIYQIDYYKNKKIQYIFNTESSIYIIDRNGDLVDGFPIALPSQTSNAMLMTQYQDNKDIRYFVGCNNENIYGYEKNGKPLTGWSPKTNVGLVNGEINRVLVNGKDYIYFTNSAGEFHALDRRGEKRFAAVETIPGISPFRYLNEKFVAGYKGKVVEIDINGKATEKEILDSTFTYCVPVFSKIKDKVAYAFANKNTFKLNTSQWESLASFTVEGTIKNIDSFDNKGKIWFLIYTENSVYMIDELGVLHPDFPLQTNTQISFINLIDGKEKLLVYAQENTLIVKEISWTNQ